MGMTDDHFRRWYEEPLLALVATRDHRIAALILGCSILEAAIRANPRTAPGNHNFCSYDSKWVGGSNLYLEEVRTLLALSSGGEAHHFWHAFRNGFAHNLTFNTQGAGGSAVNIESVIQHDTGKAVEYIASTGANACKLICRPVELVNKILGYAKGTAVLNAMGTPHEHAALAFTPSPSVPTTPVVFNFGGISTPTTQQNAIQAPMTSSAVPPSASGQNPSGGSGGAGGP